MESKAHTLAWFSMFALVWSTIASFDVHAQNLIELEYDAMKNRSYTTLWGLGDFVPVSDVEGIFNFASKDLVKVNLSNGAVVAEFNDSPLDQFCAQYIAESLDTALSQYTDRTIWQAPICQHHVYVYKHLYAVPGSSDVICEVAAFLKRSDRVDYPIYALELIVRMDKNLTVCSINIRAKDSNFTDGGSVGGAVVDDSTLVLTTAHRVQNVPAHFVYRLNKFGVYTCETELSQLQHQTLFPHTSLLQYPAAYLALGSNVYSTNGKTVIRKPSIDSKSLDTILPHIAPLEAITHLCKLNENTFLGIRGSLGIGDAWDEWTIFLSDTNFLEVKNFGVYNEHEVLLNDVDVFEGRAYIMLFDRIRRRHLLHTIDLRNGPPARRFAFVDDGR